MVSIILNAFWAALAFPPAEAALTLDQSGAFIALGMVLVFLVLIFRKTGKKSKWRKDSRWRRG